MLVLSTLEMAACDPKLPFENWARSYDKWTDIEVVTALGWRDAKYTHSTNRRCVPGFWPRRSSARLRKLAPCVRPLPRAEAASNGGRAFCPQGHLH